eukprot:1912184-Amphidinium_carterae.2
MSPCTSLLPYSVEIIRARREMAKLLGPGSLQGALGMVFHHPMSSISRTPTLRLFQSPATTTVMRMKHPPAIT